MFLLNIYQVHKKCFSLFWIYITETWSLIATVRLVKTCNAETSNFFDTKYFLFGQNTFCENIFKLAKEVEDWRILGRTQIGTQG